MQIVDKKKFEKAPEHLPLSKEDLNETKELSEEEFKQMMEDMQNPVKAQQHLAVQIKTFLDKRIEHEMAEKGFLSDHTRRWVEAFNNILEKIQKALYGDKSMNLHLHKVSHSHIAAEIRKVDD